MSNNIYNTVLRKEERSDEEYSYSYELLMREGNTLSDWKLPLYSIKVAMTDSNGNRRHASARDLYSCKEKALAFFDKIVRNLATPIDLNYIIEDEMTN